MTELTLLHKILSEKFLAKKQHLMQEKDVQTVSITNGRKTSYYLYRFDIDECKDFIPFFNSNDDAPTGLRSFCDYLLLVERNSKVYILLVELKSGRKGHFSEQLKATECFVKYILDTAERIKTNNDFPEFDRNNIDVRKICVKSINNKKTTNVSKTPLMECHNDIYTYPTRDFDILYVCRASESHR